jgi:signal transduction histidine kinase/CheY-like chemotaxis protein
MYHYVSFLSSFFDISILTILIWTLYIAEMPLKWIHVSIFPVYFLIVGSTAFHHRKGLALFAGFFSVCAYCLFCLITYARDGSSAGRIFIFFIPSLGLLLIMALICEFISRNNSKLLGKVTGPEEGFNNVGETLPLLFLKLNKRGKIIWTSLSIKFGISSNEMKGRNISDFIDESEFFKFDGQSVQGTFRVRNFPDDIKFVDCAIYALDEKSDSDLLEGYMIDVSDRERAILQSEKMEKKLFQYKKMESLGTLASGMAHDFNNILQAISDVVDRVNTETSEPETRNGMELVSETLADAGFLISELSALGRKKPLNYTPLNVPEFLREIVPYYSKHIGDQYTVDLNIPEENLWIQGDADYLKRIFQNLFGNARDAMPGGGNFTIECFLSYKEGEDRSVVIRFSDTGIGIPENIIEKIFDPFYTTKKKGKGTGLGLALVSRIVTLHKGQISVEKTGSQGTTFRIDIPQFEKDTSGFDTRVIYVKRLTTTVLLLDDDPKIRKILNFFLTDLSYKTLEASTMNEGLDQLKKNINDCKILIMDWKLKDNEPYTVIENSRALNPELIIIVVSGYSPSQKAIKKMNIFRWITKPFDKDHLDLEIQKALHLAEKE